jgi:hypothetical protein
MHSDGICATSKHGIRACCGYAAYTPCSAGCVHLFARQTALMQAALYQHMPVGFPSVCCTSWLPGAMHNSPMEPPDMGTEPDTPALSPRELNRIYGTRTTGESGNSYPTYPDDPVFTCLHSHTSQPTLCIRYLLILVKGRYDFPTKLLGSATLRTFKRERFTRRGVMYMRCFWLRFDESRPEDPCCLTEPLTSSGSSHHKQF